MSIGRTWRMRVNVSGVDDSVGIRGVVDQIGTQSAARSLGTWVRSALTDMMKVEEAHSCLSRPILTSLGGAMPVAASSGDGNRTMRTSVWDKRLGQANPSLYPRVKVVIEVAET